LTNEFLGYEKFNHLCDISKVSTIVDFFFSLKFDGLDAPKLSKELVKEMIKIKTVYLLDYKFAN
jgi:hypothetical protein